MCTNMWFSDFEKEMKPGWHIWLSFFECLYVTLPSVYEACTNTKMLTDMAEQGDTTEMSVLPKKNVLNNTLLLTLLETIQIFPMLSHTHHCHFTTYVQMH